MIYVMADLHGEYDKYLRMLEKIHFSDEDTLYILGDVVDRGPEPIKLLKDMMNRANVYPIMGNHDYMARYLLQKLSVEITEDNFDSYLDEEIMRQISGWQTEGGVVTMEQFRKLSENEKTDILDYISEFSLCEVVEVDEHIFILTHAGLGNFRPDKKLRDYTAEELLGMTGSPDDRYYEDEDVTVISGHTPTLALTGKTEIFHHKGRIHIDCGATFPKGRLACLCLDTMEEFYI